MHAVKSTYIAVVGLALLRLCRDSHRNQADPHPGHREEDGGWLRGKGEKRELENEHRRSE